MSEMAMMCGLADPVYDSQRIFRTVLDVMSRPGRIMALASELEPPSPLLATSACLLLALADYETTVWLDSALTELPAAGDYIRFHTGARLTRDCGEADFAVVAAPTLLPPLTAFAQGTPEYPDRSTTLIVQAETLSQAGWVFQGPGIPNRMAFRADPLPADFGRQLAANRTRFPCGVDLVFATPTELAALPRSCRIVEGV